MSMIHEITADDPAQQAHAAQRPRRIVRPRQDLRPRQQGLQGARRHVHQAAATKAARPRSIRRFPKRGFTNDNFERRFHIVNLADLESL